MQVTIRNPTRRVKAVRTTTRLESILPGDELRAEVNWTQGERNKYVAAGLEISDAASENAAPVEEAPVEKAPPQPKKRPKKAEGE